MAETVTIRRIAWLDSCNMTSHIHLTDDDGETTLCGHSPRSEKAWKITSQVPRAIKGSDRHCKRCFEIAQVKKSIPFIAYEDPRVTSGECSNTWPHDGAGKGL